MASDEDRLARYAFGDLGVDLDLGINLGNSAQARLGYAHTRRKIERETGSLYLPEDSPTDSELRLQFTWDSRGTPFNPTRGVAAALEGVSSGDVRPRRSAARSADATSRHGQEPGDVLRWTPDRTRSSSPEC